MKLLISSLLLAAGCFAMSAQNSLPAPGSGSMGSMGGGNSLPAPGSGGGYNPGPNYGPGPAWGNPWYGPMNVGVPMSAPSWQNAGTTNVVGCGYDAQGIWRVIPMTVSYQYNGVQYDVTVLNAWNPWADCWNYSVDQPAYNTNYWLRGSEFNFYTVLSTGTFYFNL